jgi:ribosome maturation factor RimP
MLNQSISQRLDEIDLVDQRFTLEVSSPGIDRTIKKDTELLWAKGKRIKLIYITEENKRRELIGELLDFDEDWLMVKAEGSNELQKLKRSDILKMQLLPKL